MHLYLDCVGQLEDNMNIQTIAKNAVKEFLESINSFFERDAVGYFVYTCLLTISFLEHNIGEGIAWSCCLMLYGYSCQLEKELKARNLR